jgi:hypothetical protein
MHNVHEPQGTLFETRWTLSYLRGPMTREQLQRAAAADGKTGTERPAARATGGAPAPSTRQAGAAATSRPVLPAGIREVFLTGDPGSAEYTPVLYGAARIHYADTKRGIDHTESLQVVTPLGTGAVAADWDAATGVQDDPESLQQAPPSGEAADYGPLPPAALQAKSYVDWTRDFTQWLQRSHALRLYSAKSLGLVSQPDETERDFRIRLQQASRETRDGSVETIRARYATKVGRLTQKVRSAEEAVAREQQQAQQQTVQSAVSIGATLLGALMGRKAVSMSTLGRATTAARGVSRSMKETQDISRAKERLEEASRELEEMQRAVESEIAELTATAGAVELETIDIKPKRGAVDVRLVTLAWKPDDRKA